MKCLSLRQPFSDLVVSGAKTIELRKWNTNFRGPFLVHASGNLDEESCRLFNIDGPSLVRRAIIGQATLVEVKEYKNDAEFAKDKDKHLATSNYSGSKYGFLLKDAVRFEKPIPMPGKLGFFEVAIKLKIKSGPEEI